MCVWIYLCVYVCEHLYFVYEIKLTNNEGKWRPEAKQYSEKNTSCYLTRESDVYGLQHILSSGCMGVTAYWLHRCIFYKSCQIRLYQPATDNKGESLQSALHQTSVR